MKKREEHKSMRAVTDSEIRGKEKQAAVKKKKIINVMLKKK